MLLLKQLNEHLKDLPIDWQICGGFAIDLFLDKETRKHKDLDITVSFADMTQCIEFLRRKGWQIIAPIGNKRCLHIATALERDDVFFDNIWCYKEGASFITQLKSKDGYDYYEMTEREQVELDFIEVLFNKVENASFYYGKNNKITRPVEKAFVRCNNYHILAPEIIMLYKSRNTDNINYKLDFDLAYKKLSKESKDWLETAMYVEYPNGHPWLTE